MSDLPIGWAEVTAAEACELIQDCEHRTPKYSADGLPALRPRDVVGGQLTLDTAAKVSPAEYAAQTRRYRPRAGDIVYSRELSLGWAAKLPAQVVCLSQGMVVMSSGCVMLADYLVHFLNGPGRAKAVEAQAGSAHPHLNLRAIRAFRIPLAPLSEQKRIVTAIEEAFSKLDAGEAALRATRQRLKRLRESVLAAAVTGRLVPQDPTDEPASNFLARIGAGPATPPESVLPSGWASATLGSLLERIEAGKSFATEGRPAREDEFGVIKVSAMTWGEFRPSQNKALPAGLEIENRWLIRRGDLLFSRANTADYVGAVVLVGADHPRLILSDKSLRLVVGAGVEPSWLLHVLRSSQARTAIESLATGTKESMRNISQEKLRILRIPLPPTVEQNRIVSELERQFSFIEACQRTVDVGLVRSAALRRSILKSAFQGKLVSQDPADEPAEALLRRIAESSATHESREPKKVQQMRVQA
jgi:type I restriction enzyme, S subunit